MPVPRLLVIWVTPVSVRILRISLIHRGGRSRRLRIVRLSSIRVFLIIGVVEVVVVRDVSVVWISASTARDGSGRRRQVSLTPCLIVISIIVYGRHRRIILRVTGCLMMGVWLVIRRHNGVIANALLISGVAVKVASGSAVFQGRYIVHVVVDR